MPCNVLCSIVLIWCLCTGASAAGPAPLSQRGLDLLVLRDDPALCGAIVGADADGLLHIVVERKWLRSSEPEFYRAVAADELKNARAALEELQSRIAEWKERRPEALKLLAFLTLEERRAGKELERLAGESAELDSQFLLLTFAAGEVRRVYRQPPERRQAALFAWRERLADVATRSMGDLMRELRERQVAITAEPVDLSDRLPPQPQSDREWAARVALVEHQYLDGLELQGTGSVLVPTDADARPPLAQLIGELYRSEVAKLLEEVAGPQPQDDSWITTATKLAEQRQVSGARVTRLLPDLTNRRVTVSTCFLARLPGDVWEIIWSHTETADASRPRAQIENRIAKDPQVRQALETVRALGLAGDDAVQTAIRFGAATMEAQQTADARFRQFHDRYLRRLDGPPIVWPAQ